MSTAISLKIFKYICNEVATGSEEAGWTSVSVAQIKGPVRDKKDRKLFSIARERTPDNHGKQM